MKLAIVSHDFDFYAGNDEIKSFQLTEEKRIKFKNKRIAEITIKKGKRNLFKGEFREYFPRW